MRSSSKTNRAALRSRDPLAVPSNFEFVILVVPPGENPPIRTRRVETSMPMPLICVSLFLSFPIVLSTFLFSIFVYNWLLLSAASVTAWDGNSGAFFLETAERSQLEAALESGEKESERSRQLRRYRNNHAKKAN